MIKILFRSVEATVDFGKAISDFIAFAQAAYPDLDVINIDTVPLTGRNTILKIVMADESSIEHNKGAFATPEELITAYPTGELGDWAIVGSTDTMWVWDTTLNSWKDTGAGSIATWGSIGGDITTQGDLTLALGAKVDKVAGKGLSTNDYTTAEKTKVSNIDIIDTLAALKLVTGTEPKIVYCSATGTYYKYLTAGAAFIINDLDVVITGDGGNTRWIGFAGKFINDLGNIVLQEDLIPIDFMEDGTAAPDASELYTNGVAKIRVRKFSGVINQDLYFNWPVPEKIDTTLGIQFAVEYIISEVIAPAIGQTVIFTLAGYSVGNGDIINQAFGATKNTSIVHPAGDAQHDRYLTNKSDVITVTNLTSIGTAILQLVRDAVTGTYAQKVAVTGIRIYWSRLKA